MADKLRYSARVTLSGKASLSLPILQMFWKEDALKRMHASLSGSILLNLRSRSFGSSTKKWEDQCRATRKVEIAKTIRPERRSANALPLMILALT
jgi:hypothetical protein